MFGKLKTTFMSSGGCELLLRLRWRILLFSSLVVWTLLMQVISAFMGFNFYIVITMILIALTGFLKVTKCWSGRAALSAFLPQIFLIILFSMVLIFTSPTSLTVLGIDETTALDTTFSLETFFGEAYTLALTTVPSATTLSWFAIYLPFYIGGLLAFVAGDSLDMKVVKTLAVVAIFIPVALQMVAAFGALPGFPGGLLSQFLPTIDTGNIIIDSFLGIAGSVLDWLIVGILLSAEKLIPEAGETGE